ncbi:PAS domain-containing sensor histidine kinase [Caulobacter radicis]|uniref:histidine kinase n=1 Tax=Caulobacter radicis TaxID=2172650 RepID=A0A2T9JQM4_9CAUL|nr:ATP-binding protein [Caulobacter radicis]PVM85994.1 PAS domain-containing sensor histidine kinase [Caulobacter radicis]
MSTVFRSLARSERGDLVDLASEAVVVCDPSGVVRYWNPAAEALYGWPAMAMVGLGLSDLAADPLLHDEEWALLLLEGAWEGAVRRRGAIGPAVVASGRRTVRRNPDGSPRDVVEYSQPLAVQAEETPLEARAGHQRASAACWELDISAAAAAETGSALLEGCRIIDANTRAVRLFGAAIGREHMAGRALADFWPAESRESLAELLGAALRQPSVSPLARALGPHGLLAGATATAWRSAEPARPDVLFLMVTAAVCDDRTAWELQASEDRYRKLIHFSPTPLWHVDARRSGDELHRLRAEGIDDIMAYLDANPALVELAKDIVVVTDVNQAAVSLFGARNPAELLQSVRYLFSATPDMAKRVMKAHFEGARNYVEQAKMATFDGRVLDVVLSVTYPTPPEYMDTTFITIEDITERLRTEAELRRLQSNFAHAARVSTLGELATSIAHEVNQPLSAILTNAETSLRWLGQPRPNLGKVRTLTERIAVSASRASEIIQRIRGMAMKREPQPGLLDLSKIIDEALTIVRHEVETKAIALILTVEPGLPAVDGDRVQLQQVLVNLLVNSIQAIENAGVNLREIRLGAIRAGRGVVIWVHDSGPGIADQHLASIFDGFFTTKETGIGMGLAICQSIIAEHGGEISAANHEDGGAIFRITLPFGRGV